MKNYIILIIALIVLAPKAQIAQIQLQYSESDYIRLTSVPILIKTHIDSVIISKTGENIFNKYFLFDTIRSGLYPGNPSFLQLNKTDYQYFYAFLHYNIYYDFVIPEKPWQRVRLVWYLDSLGNIIHYPECLPNCISNPSNCTFNVDSLKAISIAKLNGIPLDEKENIIAELSTGRGKDGVRIVWVVTGYKDIYDGAFYYIDIITGELINKESFKRYY